MAQEWTQTQYRQAHGLLYRKTERKANEDYCEFLINAIQDLLRSQFLL